ncbi:hypothetical protein [Asticcacaulis tiandongensis]|uniref:hypothetical protein n=1 Tax=Asticcacaulis tiandongensis TaxID=2565365 RepID=UPI00112D7F42|nr:hypothetical protein [Asticcacaulis tiandongensis]
MTERDNDNLVDASSFFERKVDQAIIAEAIEYTLEEQKMGFSMDDKTAKMVEDKIDKIIGTWPRLPIFTLISLWSVFAACLNRYPQTILDWCLLALLCMSSVAFLLDVKYWRKEINLTKEAKLLMQQRARN